MMQSDSAIRSRGTHHGKESEVLGKHEDNGGSGKQLGSRRVSREIYELGEGGKEGLRGQGPRAWGTGVSGVVREVGV